MPVKKEKETKKCKYALKDYECSRYALPGDELCIFHSKDIEGKEDKFNDAFWKEFERQKENEKEYDFTGFVIVGDFSFEEIEFEKDVYFMGAEFFGRPIFAYTQFYEKADFRSAQFDESYFNGAQFSGLADFGNTQFSYASFSYVQFSGMASFNSAQFSEEADFEHAKFSEEVAFENAKFYGAANFKEAQFYGEADFRCTQFSGPSDFWHAQFSREAYFRSAQFSGNVNFGNVKFKGDTDFGLIKIKKYNSFEMIETYVYNVFGLIEFIDANKKKFKYSNKTEFLPDNFCLILGEEATARYPIISRKIRDDMYLLRVKKKHPKIHFIWWLFADCGRSFLRWAGWSLFFAFLFGLIYTPCFDFLPDWWSDLCNKVGPQFEQTSKTFSGQPPGFWSSLYFSIVTFTTLGFGDIVAANISARIIVTFEVILGYIMLGGLISILANKLARRS